jgi:hypothetical protein
VIRIAQTVLAMALAGGLAAAELTVTAGAGWLRPGTILRAVVRGEPPIGAAFPATLRWNLGPDAGEVILESPSQLAIGIALAIPVERDVGPTLLVCTITDAGRSWTLRGEAPLASAARLGERIASVHGVTPAERLRDERLAELLDRWPCPPLAVIHQAEGLLVAPPDPAGVIVDPVDGSVQPVRRHFSPGRGPGDRWAVLLMPAGLVEKSRWPEPPAGVIAAAQAAGYGVIEAYPAGDPDFTGASQARLEILAADATEPPLLVGIGSAAAGARLAYRRDPRRWAGVVAAPSAAAVADPRIWQIVEQPTGEVPQAPLTAYARGPFVIVIGTGEHDTAAENNVRLAESFRIAWARHAHGLPPVVLDTDYDPTAWSGYHLVLVGSPRSNTVLARRSPPLAATWDDRSVSLEKSTFRRQPPPFCALAITDPPAVVIDGAWPTDWFDGLPLSQAGDAPAILRSAVPTGTHTP